jgi:imidazolonepropionase-like amidohydrolase
MERRLVTAALLSLLAASCTQGFGPAAHDSAEPELITDTPYAPDAGTVLVRCGKLIDGLADEALGEHWVLIRDGRITAVTDEAGDPGIDRIPLLDLSEYTCLPGLIDMHTHILEDPETLEDLSAYFGHDEATTLQNGQRIARTTLMAGFTTVRNVGVYVGTADVTMRDFINLGAVIGPRMQVSGFYLTIPGGGGDLLTPGVDASTIPPYLRMGVTQGVEQFREKARLAVDSGVDFVKIIASGAVLAYGGVPGDHEMTAEEMRAVVEVAHAAGLKVAAHAHGAAVIRDAILAGADTIEHASLIDEEGIALAKEHDVPLVMDVFNGDWMLEEGRKAGWPDEFLRKTEETTLIQRQQFQKAVANGTPIVFGSDAGVYTHGLNATQFQYMVRWGMTPMQAIKAATSRAAHYLGWEDRVGAIEPGRFGDLIAVKGDPLEDVSTLLQVEAVVKGGNLFKAPAE